MASSQVKDRESYIDNTSRPTTGKTEDEDDEDEEEEKISGQVQVEEEQEKREDDGIEIESSDSGEFFSIPNTPAQSRNVIQNQGKVKKQ